MGVLADRAGAELRMPTHAMLDGSSRLVCQASGDAQYGSTLVVGYPSAGMHRMLRPALAGLSANHNASLLDRIRRILRVWGIRVRDGGRPAQIVHQQDPTPRGYYSPWLTALSYYCSMLPGG